MVELICVVLYVLLGIPGTRWAFNHPVWGEDVPEPPGPVLLLCAWLVWGPLAASTLFLIFIDYRKDRPANGVITKLLRKMLIK